MKAGIVYADAVSTVSPTYAKETPDEGVRLRPRGRPQVQREKTLYGILNGIDYRVWNPATDKKIFKNYSAQTIDDKYVNKEALQKELGLKVDCNIPMLAVISRLADQKGMDLLARIIGDILNMKIQFVVLGAGDQKYHVLLEKMARSHPKNTSVNLRFDTALAEKIYAACDLLLMPSRYEPCGLTQMIGFKYGAVPVVRRTGGLKDSIDEFDSKTREGTGFTFGEYKPEAFFAAIRRALTVNQNRDVWRSARQERYGPGLLLEGLREEYLKLYSSIQKKASAVV